jgi:hypothetical protein
VNNYVTDLTPDRLDADSSAFDSDMICALAAEEPADCDGCLIERPTDGEGIEYLCAAHAASVDWFMAGLHALVRERFPRDGTALAAEPMRRAG